MKIKRVGMILSVAAFAIGVFGCGNAVEPVSKPAEAMENSEESGKGISFLQNYLVKPEIDFLQYKKQPPIVKGIYVSRSISATPDLFESRLNICQETEINSMVIDIKESEGTIFFEGIAAADEMGVSKDYIKDMKQFLKRLEDNDVYTIGRIVTFKDDAVAEKHPEFALKLADGTIFREKTDGPAWLNPYNRDVWKYIADIAKGAAELGFKEIQFDYFRFPTSPKMADAQFGDTGGLSREEIIIECAKYMVEQLKPYGANVSVDVYGTIILSDLDASIVGQNYTELCKIFDYVCPMVYPSHFAHYTMDIDYPDLHPYDIIYKSLLKSNERLQGVEGVRAVIRPWLQDFTASYLKNHYQTYKKEQILEQIQACYDAGINEWLLWSSGRENTVDALLPKELAE